MTKATSDKIYNVYNLRRAQSTRKKHLPVSAILELFHDGWISTEIGKLLHIPADDVTGVIMEHWEQCS